MEFLINEQQLKIILQEQDRSKMSEYMKELYSFTYDIVNKVVKSFKLNVKMLLTWGVSVAGLLRPLDVWLKSNNFNISDEERALILAGIGMILFFESKSVVGKILKKIKELGLEDVFEKSLKKSNELKSAFLDLMSSINVSIGSFMDIIAYSFLIPILTDIHYLSTGANSLEDVVSSISERLIASGVVVVSSKSLVSIVKKLIKRFRERLD